LAPKKNRLESDSATWFPSRIHSPAKAGSGSARPGRVGRWGKPAIGENPGSPCRWWLTYPSEKYDFVSWDDDPIYETEKKKMFQTTNQYSMFPTLVAFHFSAAVLYSMDKTIRVWQHIATLKWRPRDTSIPASCSSVRIHLGWRRERTRRRFHQWSGIGINI